MTPDNRTGRAGEEYAAEYLARRGYEILARNYHSRYGEVDLICRKDGFLVFAEVKTRAANAPAPGRCAVTPAKQKRLIRTAQLYLQELSESEPQLFALQPRFDVLELSTARPGVLGDVRITHLENAFGAQGWE